MNLQPMNDYLFVRIPEKKEEMSSGGIIIPEGDKRPWRADPDLEHMEGEVVAVGPGKLDKRGRRESMWGIRPGMKIAFSPNGNYKQKFGDEELTVIKRDSVYGEKA